MSETYDQLYEISGKQRRRRIRNRNRKKNKKIKYDLMSEEDKLALDIKLKELERLKNPWILFLPSEVIHIICLLCTMKDAMHLSLCNTLLNNHINSNEFWRNIFIKHYNEKPNKDNEGKWRQIYIEKYQTMMLSIDDKLMWVIKNNYYNQICDVLQSKNFMTNMQFDTYAYLDKTLEQPNCIEMLTILFNHNWDLQEDMDKLLYKASETGMLSICKVLLNRGADKYYRNSSSLFPLIMAALNDKLEQLDYMVLHKMDTLK